MEVKEKVVPKPRKKEDMKKQLQEKTKKLLTLMGKYKKYLIIGGAILFVTLIVALVFTNMPQKATVFTESSLKEVLEIGDLSTVEYTYNSIVSIPEEKDPTKIKYHVSYEGLVKAGIDFEAITITQDEENKVFIVNIPEIKITSTSVNPAGLDAIFTKKKYETETILQEAFHKCEADLQQKAESNTTLKKMAEESALATVRALFDPLAPQLPEGYTFLYQ